MFQPSCRLRPLKDLSLTHTLPAQAFTRVFGPDSKQNDVFNHVAVPLLERFLQGDSCVLFAYGMTNAGKTYTIQGNTQQPGIMPHLVNAILQRMADKTEWDLQTSMLEIYQEKIFDLLGKKRDKLSIRDGNGRVEVIKLSSHPISSADEAVRLMDDAASRRSKANTFLNSGSSRSHAIYTLTLNRVVAGREQSAIFQVVDLAGAERGSRTKASASQQKEANNINMSLMQLWRCLQAMRRKVRAFLIPSSLAFPFPLNSLTLILTLAHTYAHLHALQSTDGSSQPNMDIIPFRESKLTHLLMPLLGRVGLAGMAMLTCVNPQVDDYDETLSILSNASLACKIKEITDLGRTTVGVVGVGAASQGGGGAHRSLAGPGATHRSSSILGNKANQPSALKRNHSKSSAASLGDAAEYAPMQVIDPEAAASASADVLKELQKLREEVGLLKTENEALLLANFEKETEVRQEVAGEMARMSGHLLEQIQELQEQLDAKENHFHDVTKSCKKARRKQMEIESAETAKDLKEAEEELERVKAQYEGDLEVLRGEKREIELELEEWRGRAQEAQQRVDELSEQAQRQAAALLDLEQKNQQQQQQLQQQQEQAAIISVFQMPARRDVMLRLRPQVAHPVPAPAAATTTVSASAPSTRNSRSGSVSSLPASGEEAAAVDESRKSAAAEQFSQRISRDQRFKKTAADAAAPTTARSPLKPVSANSPISKMEKRALSPKGVRSTSPARKHQAVEQHHVKQPVMKAGAHAHTGIGANENSASTSKRPLRSTMRA